MYDSTNRPPVRALIVEGVNSGRFTQDEGEAIKRVVAYESESTEDPQATRTTGTRMRGTKAPGHLMSSAA